jgi:alpha-L-rhamnosidase
MNRTNWLAIVLLASAMAPVAMAEAVWITDAGAQRADSSRSPVALQFRRELALRVRPSDLRVQVSADNRFVLFVNGRRAGAGPARGDLGHWRYEEIDLAPFLVPGVNVIAAQVWNDAGSAPMAQVTSGHTGFWLHAPDASVGSQLDSGPEWRVRVDASRTVEPAMPGLQGIFGRVFYAAGPPETHTAAGQLPDWATGSSQVAGWKPAIPVSTNSGTPWSLVADALPAMRFEPVSGIRLVRANGTAQKQFPGGVVAIPAHSEVSLLLDMGRVLSAYPELVVSGGTGAQIELTYAEALYDPVARSTDPTESSRIRLSDRAAVGAGEALGLTDTFKPDGRSGRKFRPFWWRTWRFLELRVRTSGDALRLENFTAAETGYPFVQRGWFHSDDPELDALWLTGWATARVDAHETYMDSSYWEQLQYIGDTRIQMLVSYDVAGDARLAVQALAAFDSSRGEAALPQAAWPNVYRLVIPPFALIWIGGLHDYWMHQPDTSVLTRTLPGTRAVLDEFARHVLPTGLVGPIPGWPFVDWVTGLDGWADRDRGALSCIISMQYVGALHEAAALERALGEASRSDHYLVSAARTRDGINSECWDEQRGLYADTPAKTQFSQHGAALAVLYDIAARGRQRTLLERVTIPGHGLEAPPGIASTSFYFSFYLARAFEHAGLTDRYLDLLKPWRTMLKRHFTTWPEKPDPSRSDTHAWSAHPTVGLTTYVAGIKPAAPGYTRVLIEPHLGNLRRLDAAVTHPSGLIEARYQLRAGRFAVRVRLPPGVSGMFQWQGQTRALVSGGNRFTLISGVSQGSH